MELNWTEHLSVGNAIIDSDHKELFGLVRAIDCATKAKDYFALQRALEQLGDCMNRHFLNEELLADALNIPFAAHKTAHQNIQDEINFTKHQIGNDSVLAIFVMEHYAHFLRDWLFKHIVEEDMLMKPMLQTRHYEFKVEGVSAGWN